MRYLQSRWTSMMISCFTVVIAFFTFSVPVVSAKVIEISVNDHNPAASTPGHAWDDWAKWVEDHCNGKVKVTVHHGGALLKNDEAYRGTQTGIVSIAHYTLNSVDGFNLNTVMTLPFMNWPGQAKTAEIYKGLLKKYPQMTAEWKGVKPLGIVMMPPTHLHMVKQVVRTPQDLKGLKLHGAETAIIEVMAAAGTTPVQLDIADMYMALDRGLIDGVVNHFPVLGVFGVLKLMPNHTVFGEGGINMTPMFNIINTDFFNKLPQDIQKVLTDSGKAWEEIHLSWDNVSKEQAMEGCREHNFVNLSDDEIKAWYDLVKEPIHEKWIRENADKGAKEIYEDALSQVAQAGR